MSDPFAQLAPAKQAEIRLVKTNQSLSTYRYSNIALSDLYICDKNYKVPEPVGEDGQPLTYERRLAIAAGVDIKTEQLGESAIKNRPKHIRFIKPKEWTPVSEVTCLTTTSSSQTTQTMPSSQSTSTDKSTPTQARSFTTYLAAVGKSVMTLFRGFPWV